MRGPLADTWELGQALDSCLRIVMWATAQRQFARYLRPRESNDAFAPGAWNAKLRDVVNARPGDARWQWCQTVQFRIWCDDAFAECGREPSGDRRRGLY